MEEGKQQKQIEHEVRDIMKSLNICLSDIRHVQDRRSGSSQRDDTNDDTAGEDDDHGVMIITLSGSNIGSTMKSDSDELKPGQHGMNSDDETEGMETYVNSNFQAVNNSIMMGSTYTSHDPGVQVEVSDAEEPEKKAHKRKKIGELQHEAPTSV